MRYSRFGSIVVLLAVVLFCSIPAKMYAQTLRILDISTAKYPRIEAQCVMYDAQKRFVYPQRAQDIVLRENNRVVANVELKLPERKLPRAISAVLALDISGSMEGTRLDNAKSAAYTLIEEMPLDMTECAITSFDDRTAIVRDFSQNKEDLFAGIYSLKHGGGTDYNTAFMGKTGAFRVLSKARFRRVIVFLTDGLSEADTTAILKQARGLGATIYCVTLNMPMPNVLRMIADNTGGKAFENIRSREEAHAIYREILRQELDVQPFTVAWDVIPNCTPEHYIDIALPKYNVRESVIVEKPETERIALKISPRSLHFPVLPAGATQGVAVKLQAQKASFQVLSVTSSHIAFASLNTQFPMEISAGATKILRLRYAPKDTNYASAEIFITTDRCGVITLKADGGSRLTRTKENALALVQPQGGETLWIGADTSLIWRGIGAEDIVDIDIAVNSKPYERLFTSISGLQQPWNITTGEGDSVRLRITKSWRVETQKDPPILSLVGHRGTINSARYSADGTMIVTAGDDATVRVWNAETGDLMRTFPVELRPFISAKFFNHDKSILASNLEGRVIIYDVATGTVKQTFIAFGTQLSNFIPPDQSKNEVPEPAFIWVPDGRGRLMRVPNPQYNGGSRSSVNNGGEAPIFNRFEIYDAAISPDGRNVIGVGEFPSPVQWYARTARMDKKLPPLKTKNYSVEYAPSGAYLFVAGEKGLAVYSTSGSLLHVIDGAKGNVVSFAILPGERECIFGTTTGELFHAEITTGTFLHRVKPHNKMIVAVAQSPDKRYVAVGSVDNTISIHRTDNLQEVGRIYGTATDFVHVAFSPDGRHLVASSADGVARVWSFDVEYELQSFTMNRAFTIVRPHFLTTSIVFGSLEIGQRKDSVFRARLRNPYAIPLWVGAPMMMGRDSMAFRIVSGGNRFIKPLDSADIEVRFMPNRLGLHQARISFPAVEDTTYVSVSAIGVAPLIAQKTMLEEGLECGDEKVGMTKTMRFDDVFTNAMSQPLNVVSCTIQSSDDIFTIGKYNSVIASGATFSLPVRFQPQRVGLVSARVQITVATGAAPYRVSTYTFVVSGNGVAHILRGALIAKNSAGTLIDTLRIRRIPVQSAQPLLPYVFFASNSAMIPDRYHRALDTIALAMSSTATSSAPLNISSSTSSSISSLSSIVASSALDAHFYLLDIVGKRLQQTTAAKIELIGCNANTAEERGNLALSKRRAEAIKQYWVSAYHVDPKRITITARNLPAQFSQGKEEQSIEENRRVELSSTHPAIMAPIEIADTLFVFEPNDIRISIQPLRKAEIADQDSAWQVCNNVPLQFMIRSGLDVRPIESAATPAGYTWDIQRAGAQFPWRSGSALMTAVAHKQAMIGQCGMEIEPLKWTIVLDTQQVAQQELSAIAKRWNLILFPYNSATLSDQNKSIVQSIGSYLTQHVPHQTALVEGYTDTIGEEEYNKELSLRRAKSVAQLLNISRLSYTGIGEEIALFPNDTPEGRFLNRTVRITVR